MARHPKLEHTTTGEPYWRVRYRKADGRERALSFHGDEAEAEAFEFAALVNKLGGDRAVAWWNTHLARAPDGITLAEWWPRYLRSLTGLTDGTRDSYDRTFRRVWLEPLGYLPLTAIAREDVAEVVNDLSARRADKTVANAYGVLTSCLRVAAEDGLIPAVPTKGIRLPRRTAHETADMRFLDHAEWARLADELPAHYRPLFTFLIGTGARWGEAEALEVRDVDLAAKVVRITKAAKWNASSSTRDVGPTKTRRSRRTITLPPEVVVEIAPLLDRPPSARLFLAPRGGPLRHKSAYDEWTKAADAAGLVPRPRIHDLRHTHVAWLIAAGIPLPVIQARLGHEHISTTIDRYGHLMPDLQVAAANAASLAMRPRDLPGIAEGHREQGAQRAQLGQRDHGDDAETGDA